jgi:hypothetical protein
MNIDRLFQKINGNVDHKKNNPFIRLHIAIARQSEGGSDIFYKFFPTITLFLKVYFLNLKFRVV